MTSRPQPTPQRSFAAYRLPPGRHGLPRELVAENQRWRLFGAAAEVLAERGYAHVTTAEIVTRAGISASTFYEHFADLSACLLAAYEMAADCVYDLVSDACDQATSAEWPARLRAATDELLTFLASEPSLAYLLGVAPAGDPAIAAARDGLIESLAKFLRSGRALRGEAAPELPPETERCLLAGAFALLPDRVLAGEAECLPDLAAQLAAILHSPYRSFYP